MTQQPEDVGIGEQVVNKAAEMGLASQLQESQSIDINIQSDPLKLVQGEAESVSLKGKGLVTPQDLSLEELELRTGNIGLDLLSAALGKLQLTQQTEASIRVVLTTDDLNRALNSDFLCNQLRQLEIPVKNQALRIELQQAECALPGNGRWVLNAKMLTHLDGITQAAVLRAVLKSRMGGQSISFEEGGYLDEKDLPLELTAALVSKVSELLSLRHFQNEHLSLYLEQLEVEQDRMTLLLNVHIRQIPSM